MAEKRIFLATFAPVFLLSFFLVFAAAEGPAAQEFLIGSTGGGAGLKDPDVAFGDGRYFVVWSQGDTNVYGTRVAPGGMVLDPAGIKLPEYDSVFGGPDSRPAVSFDGTHFVVLYQSSVFDYPCSFSHMANNLLAARVATDGTVLDANARAIDYVCSIGGLPFAPDLAFGSGDYLAVWGYSAIFQGNHTRGAILTPALGASGLQISPWVGDGLASYPTDPAVAFDGANFLTLWVDPADPAAYRIYGARVTPGGSVLDPSGFPLTASGSPSATAPAVAFGSSVYLAAWIQAGNVRAARVSPDGSVLDPGGLVVGLGSGVGVAFDGTDFLVVWAGTGPNAVIRTARVTEAGIVGAGTAISGAGVPAQSPAVAFDGDRFLVCWKMDAGAGTEIYGAFVDPSTGPDPGYSAVANAEASQYGAGSVTGSGTFNALALLVLPAAAALLLRRRLAR